MQILRNAGAFPVNLLLLAQHFQLPPQALLRDAANDQGYRAQQSRQQRHQK